MDGKVKVSFQVLKEVDTKAPILRQPRWDVIFHVHSNASGYPIGVILAHPIACNIINLLEFLQINNVPYSIPDGVWVRCSNACGILISIL